MILNYCKEISSCPTLPIIPPTLVHNIKFTSLAAQRGRTRKKTSSPTPQNTWADISLFNRQEIIFSYDDNTAYFFRIIIPFNLSTDNKNMLFVRFTFASFHKLTYFSINGQFVDLLQFQYLLLFIHRFSEVALNPFLTNW